MTAPNKQTALWALALFVAIGCKKGEEQKGLRLTRDGAAVVVVDNAAATGEFAAEGEPNDEQPQAVAADGVDGALTNAKDVDRFLVSMPEGPFAITASGDGADLVVELIRNGKVAFKSDRGGKGVSEGVAGLSALAGQTVEVVVRPFLSRSKNKAQTYPLQYRLRRTFLKQEGTFEVEPNDTTDSSGVIEIENDHEAQGFVGWNGDRDVWRFSIAAGDADLERIDVFVSGIEGVQMRATLSDADATVIAERFGPPAKGVSLTSLGPGIEDLPLYLTISGKRSHPEATYTVVVARRSAKEGEELEPNDHLDRAMPLEPPEDGLLRRVSGQLGFGDVDYFAIPASGDDRAFDIEVQGLSSSEAVLDITTMDGKSIATSVEKGSSISLASVPVESGVTVVIALRSQKALAHERKYTIGYAAVAGLPAASIPDMPPM